MYSNNRTPNYYLSNTLPTHPGLSSCHQVNKYFCILHLTPQHGVTSRCTVPPRHGQRTAGLSGIVPCLLFGINKMIFLLLLLLLFHRITVSRFYYYYICIFSSSRDNYSSNLHIKEIDNTTRASTQGLLTADHCRRQKLG